MDGRITGRIGGHVSLRIPARFKELLGQTPLENVTEWRMQKPIQLLEQRDKKLIDVAQSVGHESDAAFSKAFKRVVGADPHRISNVVSKARVMPEWRKILVADRDLESALAIMHSPLPPIQIAETKQLHASGPAAHEPSRRPAPELACRCTPGSSSVCHFEQNVENPIVLERLTRGFDFSRSNADTKTRSP